MRLISACIALTLLLNTGIVQLQECGVFNENPNRIQFQGPPGKTGAPAAVDYGQIIKIVLALLRGEMTTFKKEITADMKELLSSEISTIRNEMDAKIQAIPRDTGRRWPETNSISGKAERDIARLEAEIQEMKTKCCRVQSRPDVCNFMYKDKCNWLVFEYETTYSKAVEICQRNSGRPAGIYDSAHYDVILEQTRRITADREYFSVWLGMKADPTMRTVTQPDGSSASFLRWLPGHPLFRLGYENMGVLIRRDKHSSSQGMFDYYPNKAYHGVICEI